MLLNHEDATIKGACGTTLPRFHACGFWTCPHGDGWGGGQRGLNGEQQGLDTDIYHHSAPERRDVLHRQVKMHKDLTRVQKNVFFPEKFRCFCFRNFPERLQVQENKALCLSGEESSFPVNEWALLKLLCTVGRGCAERLWDTRLLTPLLCQSGGFEAQEHLGEKASSLFFKWTLSYYVLFQYTLQTAVYCVAANGLSFVVTEAVAY